MKNWQAQALRYWLAMNASAFNAAIHAVVGFGGLASVHAVADSVPALTLQQGAYLFLATFGRELLVWLDKHPLLVNFQEPKSSGGYIPDSPSGPSALEMLHSASESVFYPISRPIQNPPANPAQPPKADEK